MNKTSNYIKNRLSLRTPQAESLEVLEKILDRIKLTKEDNNKDNLEIINKLYPICKDFERNFTSICFSLATGVGKTRLMAAFIAYLYKHKGVKNFMVIAPNLTIYNKLIKDFGDPSFEKYVFKGISELNSSNINIITGDNYKEGFSSQQNMFEITINIFNISKINSETRGGKEPLIKRLSEYIGESYFNFLASLKDLTILMDESHHYRADRGMQVLNELNPVLGLELTATPQVEKGNKTEKFKNVVYEYSLAKAIKDGYVKTPHVVTKKDFNPAQYSAEDLDLIKLCDGIKLHENTKLELDIYSRNNKVKQIKPFVLVVAKDTNHANRLKEIIQSNDFFKGYYKDKVIEIHSNQSGEEKDENISELISLEEETNRTEIVIHVNMLKEGWDVTNLYTIVPLRTSASSTLTEQTMGRGLRLPYGKVTGNTKVDRLSIVSHDKYDEIIRLANSPDSLIRKENVIFIEEEDVDSIKQIITTSNNIIENINNIQKEITSDNNWSENKNKFNKYVEVEAEKTIYSTLMEKDVSIDYNIKSILDFKKPEIKKIVIENIKRKYEEKEQVIIEGFNDELFKSIEQKFDTMIDDVSKNIIEIPRISLVQKNDAKCKFKDFELEVKNINFQPTDDTIIVTNLQNNQSEELESQGIKYNYDTNENIIISEMINTCPEIDYDSNSELLYKLVGQVIGKLNSYLSEEEISNVVLNYKSNIARYIYTQMMENFIFEEAEYEEPKVFPFVEIVAHNDTKYINENILHYSTTVPASELRQKIFTGFTKACHKQYKFDSTPEKDFVTILEKDSMKWLRPAPRQFFIYWNNNKSTYEPDFIVEMADAIYMIEIKADKDVNSEDVILKKKAGENYCKYATEFTKNNNNGKPWKYLLIPSSQVSFNRSFSSYCI